MLGERSPEEIARTDAAELQAERVTRLDRVFDRQADPATRVLDTADLAQRRLYGVEPEPVVKRLTYLRDLGLAEKLDGRRWRIADHLVPTLRDLGEYGDAVKAMARESSGRDSGGAGTSGDGGHFREFRGRGVPSDLRVHRTDGRLEPEAQPIVGTVLQRGVHDELRDIHYVLLRDRQGRHHYVQTFRTPELIHLRAGSLVAVGTWESRRGLQLGVRSVSDRPLREQITVKAATWLDRQTYREQMGKETVFPFDAELRSAQAQRQAWLTAQGYGTQRDGRFIFRDGELARLAAWERQEAERVQAKRYKQPVRRLTRGAEVEGIYEGTLSLHGGRMAVVRTGSGVALAPVRRAPRVRRGEAVAVTLQRNNVAQVRRVGTRGREGGRGG